METRRIWKIYSHEVRGCHFTEWTFSDDVAFKPNDNFHTVTVRTFDRFVLLFLKIAILGCPVCPVECCFPPNLCHWSFVIALGIWVFSDGKSRCADNRFDKRLHIQPLFNSIETNKPKVWVCAYKRTPKYQSHKSKAVVRGIEGRSDFNCLLLLNSTTFP